MKVNIGPYPKGGGDQKIEVEIHDYDTWSADCTMALVIAPLLHKFKECGGLDAIHSTDAEDFPGVGDDKETHDADRWRACVEEMIWTFDRIVEKDCAPEDPETDDRIDRGLRLFGKYFRGLWT